MTVSVWLSNEVKDKDIDSRQVSVIYTDVNRFKVFKQATDQSINLFISLSSLLLLVWNMLYVAR